jgi:molybdenum cofactor cytidylyltransferase
MWISGNPAVSGIILAAGASRRMGSPKALCKWGENTFLYAVVSYLREGGAREIGVVLGAGNQEILAHGIPEGVDTWINPDYEYGQLSSLQVGLQHQKMDTVGAAVALVDHPAVTPSTVRALVAAISEYPDRIAKPIFQGRGGHPIIIGRQWWGDIQRISFHDIAASKYPIPTLRDILARYPERIMSVDVDDPGILIDIDTPDILSKHSL